MAIRKSMQNVRNNRSDNISNAEFQFIRKTGKNQVGQRRSIDLERVYRYLQIEKCLD